jgi:hypothetical protein
MRLMRGWHCFMQRYARRHRISTVPALLQQFRASVIGAAPSMSERNRVVRIYNRALHAYYDDWEPELAARLLAEGRAAPL